MTVPESRRQAETSVAGLLADGLERLAGKLGATASVSAVFGEPVERGGITIIPVARVGLGLGAGLGRRRAAGAAEGDGGGGGGGVSATPVGYIEIKDGDAVFRPIRGSRGGGLGPLAAVVAGAAALRIVRGLAGIRRRRHPGRRPA